MPAQPISTRRSAGCDATARKTVARDPRARGERGIPGSSSRACRIRIASECRKTWGVRRATTAPDAVEYDRPAVGRARATGPRAFAQVRADPRAGDGDGQDEAESSVLRALCGHRRGGGSGRERLRGDRPIGHRLTGARRGVARRDRLRWHGRLARDGPGAGGTSGQSTDVMLVLDISGSIGSPSSKYAQLKQAAADTIAALDAADGSTDQTITGNDVGIEYYHDSTATIAAPIGSSYSALTTAIAHLPAPEGSTPQDVAITAAANALDTSTSGYAKAMVLITDGQTRVRRRPDERDQRRDGREEERHHDRALRDRHGHDVEHRQPDGLGLRPRLLPGGDAGPDRPGEGGLRPRGRGGDAGRLHADRDARLELLGRAPAARAPAASRRRPGRSPGRARSPARRARRSATARRAMARTCSARRARSSARCRWRSRAARPW